MAAASSLVDYRVLVADDDERVRGSLASLLDGEGFDTLPVNCGTEVLRLLQAPRSETRIDFLVLDYNMPDLTGVEVLRRMREHLGLFLPSILVSGEFSDDLEQMVLEVGGFALVSKPIQPASFRRLVWKLVKSELGH